MLNNFGKFFSRFGRTHHFVTRVIETNIPVVRGEALTHYKNTHTIVKGKSAEQEANPRKGDLYELDDSSIIPGFIADKNKSCLHLLNNNTKILKVFSASFYHALADDLAEIVYALSIHPGAEVILDVSNTTDILTMPYMNFFSYFLDRLDAEGIQYQIVDIAKYDLIYINNFYLANFDFHSGARLDLLDEFLADKSAEPVKPFRKVFISRKMQGYKPDNPDAAHFSYKNDTRIDNHEELEKMFSDMGFEIVDAELITDFKVQMQIFREAKIVASLTSSGLTNAIFMQPGTTMVEIVTPLITQSPVANSHYFKKIKLDPKDYELDLNTVQEVHMFYHNLAFFKNLAYVGIPNFSRKNKEVKEFIDTSPVLSHLLND